MDDALIQAYVWEKIIRQAFSPSGVNEQRTWLHKYYRSLGEFWEVDYPLPPKPKANGIEIKITSGINIDLDGIIYRTTKFIISLQIWDKKTIWSHDVDPSYFGFPNQKLLNEKGKEKQALQNIKAGHIEKIIDGLLCHPRAHQHVESLIDGHEIRIGGGIDNAFVFLFHLRYQLCPFPNKRDEEKKRLCSIFYKAIKQSKVVTIPELMAIPH